MTPHEKEMFWTAVVQLDIGIRLLNESFPTLDKEIKDKFNKIEGQEYLETVCERLKELTGEIHPS